MVFKIPIWKNAEDYIDSLRLMISEIIALADVDFQKRVWRDCKGPEVDSYVECLTSFDTDIELLLSDIQKKRISLEENQLKAILDLYKMCDDFDKIYRKTLPPNSDWDAEHDHIFAHPDWNKVVQQAQYALSLLKKP